MTRSRFLAASITALGLAACAPPEIGSQAWCEDLLDRPKHEWTVDEIRGLTGYCIAPEDTVSDTN